MATHTRAEQFGIAPELMADVRLAAVGAAISALGTLLTIGHFGAVRWLHVDTIVTIRLWGENGFELATAINATAAVIAVVGMLVAGQAVARQPKNSVVLAIASATAFLAYFATIPDWDAIRIMMIVMAVLAGAVAILLRLPPTVQRVAVSLFVIYHFCGILSAITSPPPTPWLTGQLWTRLFRPHLEFCYVNNAYQFYSPQPGPANILWFCIYREDNKAEWLKMPRRSEVLDPLSIEYYRRLSLTERANQNVPLPLGPQQDVMGRRLGVTDIYPFLPELLPTQQYRLPNEHARQIFMSYAIHVAKTYKERTGVGVKSVKTYLTMHRMLNQAEFAADKDPYAPTTYWPFFVGEFDSAGNLLDPNEPMLYWIVPVLPGEPGIPGQNPYQPGANVRNYVTLHAGSDPFETP